jgi:hypothetical protein
MIARPSETIQATVGSVVGAVLIIMGAFFDTSKLSPEVVGAIILLLSWIAAAVTWYVARKERDPMANLTAGKDGTVVGGK